MENPNATTAVFSTYQRVEEVLMRLQQANYDTSNLSIVGKTKLSTQTIYNYFSMGSLCEVIRKRLAGPTFFCIPGFGHLLIAGPLLNTLQHLLIASLKGDLSFSKLSAFGATLVSLGIPEDSIHTYENQIKIGKYLLIATGTAKEVQKARQVFGIEKQLQLDHPAFG